MIKQNLTLKPFLLLFSLLMLLLYPGLATAQETPKVYVELILDASGSMAGKVEGRPKMQIAKEVVEGIISEAFVADRQELKFALRVYGHHSSKKKKDCTDSTLEYPFGQVNITRLKEILSRIKPLGYTPIAYSLTQAALDFPPAQKQRRIAILITDGIETCEDSPCQAAQKLMQAGAFTTIHVIGFGLTQESMSLLKCITQASGGMLMGANNALELKEAFKQTVSEAVDAGFRVKVTVNDAPTSEATIRLYPSGSTTPIRTRPTDLAGKQVIYTPPGLYDLEVREHSTDSVQWARGLSGEVGQVVEKNFNFLRGALQAKVTVNKEPTVEADIYVYRSGTRELIRKRQAELGGKAVIYLPLGSLDIQVVERTTESEQWWRNVKVKQGDSLERQFDFLRAGFKLRATVNGALSIESRFDLYRQGEKTPRRKVQAQVKQPQIIYIPPGIYNIETLSFAVQQVKWSRGITVGAGEIYPLEINFSPAGFLVGVTLNGEPTGSARIEAYQRGESQPYKQTRASFKEQTQLVLPVGEYDLRVQEFYTRQEKWHRGLYITEGQMLELRFDFFRQQK